MSDRDDERSAWYDEKSALMNRTLGEQHNVVSHAIIAYEFGGALDLYYYPSGIPGTAVATKELSGLPGEGSSNREFSCYELVMFTRHTIDLDVELDQSTPFGKATYWINEVLNYIAPFSTDATLNPGNTCEFPEEMERVGGKCLIFDAYAAHDIGAAGVFGLLAVIEIFRSEMNFSREHGSEELFKRLKAAGHYPYSDLDREPVA